MVSVFLLGCHFWAEVSPFPFTPLSIPGSAQNPCDCSDIASETGSGRIDPPWFSGLFARMYRLCLSGALLQIQNMDFIFSKAISL
jgi:hypothetical protein